MILRILAVIVIALFLAGSTSGPAAAQNAEDELGNWLIYNGTIRFSPDWSVFTEGQLRLWEVASNVNEAFVRAALHYDFANSHAYVGLGYLHTASWPYEDSEQSGKESFENRIYQQFTISQHWSRSRLEHRYRTEQRWITRTATNEVRFTNRFRYRLQVTAPLNSKSMDPGTWFLNFYEEIFISFDNARAFDQNRLYGAGGYQFAPLVNLQIGMLWQARESADFWRLQVFYTHNFDLQG